MMKLLEPSWLALLWAVPGIAALLLLAWWLRGRAVRRIVGAALASQLSTIAGPARRLGAASIILAVVALGAIALARPGWNPTPKKIQRTGRDVAILLDVSRSMLARDLAPNRLERAKLAIQDVLDAARGDRIGIIAFAGAASVRCPLTTDYAFARIALEALSPESVPVGGTLIGDAIRTALSSLFKDGEDRYRDIILITDGEDHESFPVEAAAEAGKRGVRIIAIGLGSDTGSIVPAEGQADKPMTYQGEVVRSRLDSAALRKVAAASRDGVYLNVGTGNLQLDRIYTELMERSERQQLEAREQLRYTEGFQVLLGAALALLALESLLSERRRTTA
jgi:Ca-activated chloride channel family protein